MLEVHSCKGAPHNSVGGAGRTGKKETWKWTEERNAHKGHSTELAIDFLLNCLHPLGILCRGRPNPLRSWAGPQRAQIQFLNYQKSGSVRCRCYLHLTRSFHSRLSLVRMKKRQWEWKTGTKNKKLGQEWKRKIAKTHCWDRKHAAVRNILRITPMFSVPQKILTERRSIHSICRQFKAKIPRAWS